MAEDFNASVIISTADSIRGVRDLDAAAKNLDKTLRELDGSLKASQGDLDAVAKSMATIAKANAEVIRSERDRARATTEAAKADAVAIKNAGQKAKQSQDAAIAEAKTARIKSQTRNAEKSSASTSARRDSESAARIAATNAMSQARLATESERSTAAQNNAAASAIRLGDAQARSAALSERLANSQKKAAQGALELNDNLSNSRYLLYDVGQTYTVLSGALLAIPVATSAVSIAYQKDFAQVVRTNAELARSSSDIGVLRQELKTLGTEIPLTFSQFSNIASTAGQLGIAGEDVGAFTESVARFGAASNVSVEEAATAFGRLQNSFDPLRETPDFFNKIGSAIAFVGVNSAASESEIIAVTNQIAAAGSQFKFTGEQIVGLSGALASVRIRPELARGAFQRIMLQLSRAADQGADSFNKFGKYTGLAADESLRLFKENPSDFFYKYIGGLKGVIDNGASVSSVLDDIGAKNVFDKQFILGLANGYKVYGQALSDANSAWTDGTFLNKSTDEVFETLDAKIKRITNSIQNLMDTIGKNSVAGPLSSIADAILTITNATDRLAAGSAAFSTFINIVMGLGTALGILLAFKAAQAFVLAGLVGFQQVLGKGTLAAGLTANGIMRQLAVTMLMAKGATAQASAEFVKNAGAARAMGFAATATNTQIRAANAGLGVLGTTASDTSKKGAGLVGTLKNVGSGMLGLVGGPIGALLIALSAVSLGLIANAEDANAAGDSIARAMKNGASAAQEAAAKAFVQRKVNLVDGLGIGEINKNLRQIAEEAGLSFDRVVAAAAKGKDGLKEFDTYLAEVAKSQGKTYEAGNNAQLAALKDGSKLTFLRRQVEAVANASSVSADDLKAVEKATGAVGTASEGAVPGVDALGDGLGGVGDEAETAEQKIDKFLNAIFGIANAEAAVQDSLQKLGEGLANSSDVGTGTEGGRENLSNFQDALRSAAQQQRALFEDGQQSAQQAAANYSAFIDGLLKQMATLGADPAQVSKVAAQAKAAFAATIGAGAPATVKVAADTTPAFTDAQGLLSGISRLQGDITVGGNTIPAEQSIQYLAKQMSIITGQPYQVVLDALTDPANKNAAAMQKYLIQIVNGTYKANVNADTSAAIANVQNFSNYARSELSSIQNLANNFSGIMGSLGIGGVDNIASGLIEKFTGLSSSAAPAPAQVSAAPAAVTPDFSGLGQGYQKVQDAANKAGDAGKKAGEDMADGIDEATRAATDYANRLRTGLTSVFDKQYGVQKATDEYRSALNDIKKKRDEEIKQVDDLRQKIRDLNNERNTDLVDARKAGIEKNISLKYGEVDRAADYANQEKTALDAAAAKQKDIEANKKQADTIQAGIGKLTGYSDAAIANREALRGLESKMLDMISAYAATGASQQQVAAYAARLTGQFKRDASQVGYNRNAVANLTGTMSGYVAAVNRVPRIKPTTVTADTAGAMKGIGAVGAALRGLPSNKNIDVRYRVHGGIEPTNDRTKDGQVIYRVRNPDGTIGPTKLFNKGGQVQGYASGGLIPGKAPSDPGVDNLMASVDGKGMVRVRSNEFIIQQPAVDFWGLDFMNAINNMKMPRFNSGGYTGGSSSSGGSSGPMLVELTAENIAAILRLANTPTVLYADSVKLAESVNQGNVILASTGAN